MRGRLDCTVGQQVMQQRFFFKERSVRGDQGTRGRGGGLSTASTDAVAFKGRMGNSDMQIEPDSYRCLVTGLENVAQSELKKRKVQ